MSKTISRRGALAGVAAVALTASIPASANPTADAAIVKAWERWNALEDQWCARFIASKYSGDDLSGEMPHDVESEIARLCIVIERTQATTPAGFLCKLDLAIGYGAHVGDFEEDYPLCALLSLLRDLEAASGLTARSILRKRALKKADDETAEAQDARWAKRFEAAKAQSNRDLTENEMVEMIRKAIANHDARRA